jgi:ribosomal protein S11
VTIFGVWVVGYYHLNFFTIEFLIIKTWFASSSLGFRGSRHSTNYVTQAIAENDVRFAIQLGIKLVEVKIKGLGYGKEYLLCGLQLRGLIITKFKM